MPYQISISINPQLHSLIFTRYTHLLLKATNMDLGDLVECQEIVQETILFLCLINK